ncbi:MAG: FAD-binding oxidoreductase [Rubrivivax sp.]|nr:FAD-binding oxidoreductase [Rubrivivax sp.]
MNDVDVLVIGAGIAGASVGWRLAGRRSVMLVERELQPGLHSTGRSAAMFMESYGPAGVRALTRASRSFYEDPAAGFTTMPLLSRRGSMYLATHTQQALLEHTHAELSAHGGTVERMDAAATLARVPCLRPEVVHASLYDPAAEDIDVHALHQGFLRGVKAGGGAVWTDAEVTGARHDGTRWHVALADGRTVRAGQIVNAAGAWADVVAALFGAVPVGLEPRRRSAFTFKAPAGVDVSAWPAVVGVDEGWYFKPDAGRLLGSPANADPTVPHDVRPEELDIALGIDRLQTVTTLEIRRPESTWAGLRSFVRDGELVIGPDDRSPGFHWLAAQGGYGIQSASAAGELAAALVCGEPVPERLRAHGVDAALFAPQRLH